MVPIELIEVLAEIESLLIAWGFQDRADWIAARRAVLGDSDSTDDSREFAMSELHGVVLGMGGLSDLMPPNSLDKTADMERRDRLADRLYALTGSPFP
jgi:hypothetical protein